MFYKLTVKARKLALSLEPASKNQTAPGIFFSSRVTLSQAHLSCWQIVGKTLLPAFQKLTL